MEAKKVLVILSGSDHITLTNGKVIKTGYFLSEMTIPLLNIEKQGFQAVFANPTGSAAAMDPLSDRAIWFGFDTSLYRMAKDYIKSKSMGDAVGTLSNPIAFNLLNNRDLDNYVAVFIPGGHAPVEDLENNRDLGRILWYFHNNKKPTAAICHGPIALVSTKAQSPQGTFAYQGYHLTGFSNMEEKMNEWMWWGNMKARTETELRSAGANYEFNYPFLPKVVVDKELITGQGPSSAWQMANCFLAALNAKSLTQG